MRDLYLHHMGNILRGLLTIIFHFPKDSPIFFKASCFFRFQRITEPNSKQRRYVGQSCQKHKKCKKRVSQKLVNIKTIYIYMLLCDTALYSVFDGCRCLRATCCPQIASTELSYNLIFQTSGSRETLKVQGKR
jgi:cytidylate kinase